jgi:hypothetical protein
MLVLWETSFGAVCFPLVLVHCCLSTSFLVIFRRRNVDGYSDTLDSLSSLFDIMYYSPF